MAAGARPGDVSKLFLMAYMYTGGSTERTKGRHEISLSACHSCEGETLCKENMFSLLEPTFLEDTVLVYCVYVIERTSIAPDDAL